MSVIKRLSQSTRLLVYACGRCREKFLTEVERKPNALTCPDCGGRLHLRSRRKKHADAHLRSIERTER